ncbi:MaoC/PaaZ C-terminal domain-containing protein [Streptomyces sp. CBMA152]|uniref:MaoC/PaaZ C-terminal domain-containing protein n=1 Tax=Streptomyces sp. CBMA152 TaxID=1896312 RepID=UPI0016601D7E|nr:MaoC/PaaZ C-terminal domain-containing protein [Streptomyces sp. CBMA152]MBD0743115.1 dehydratase [Streptomyces sp. CBMA152]
MSTEFSLAAVEPGAQLPDLLPEQIDRATLAAFAEAYGDPNPIHLDPSAARAAGLDDVIAHGMLSMALLGRLLVEWVPVQDVLSLRASFVAVTTVPARLRCTARVKAVEDGGPHGRTARLALAVRLVEQGTLTVRGEALVRLPGASRP